MTVLEKKIGLYLHIPFCSKLCHYCDFVKTANWTKDISKSYFKNLEKDLLVWIKTFIIPNNFKISTIYLGGGTPSLFGSEYSEVFHTLSPFLSSKPEISIEVNPENISETHLNQWKSIGINRLSIGVQSFSEKGLNFLTRNKEHLNTQKIHMAKTYFNNINLDLIYGWNQQTLEQWKDDLSELISLKPNHVSLYLLTYAERTPIGRAYFRNKIKAQEDHILEQKYFFACEALQKNNYNHNEVSNWSKENMHCRHNEIYWHDQYYIAIGAGSHGYIPSTENHYGIRYISPKNDRIYIREKNIDLSSLNFQDLVKNNPNYLFEYRNKEQWLMEYISTSIRTQKGVNLKHIEEKAHFKFCPSDFIIDSMNKKHLIQNNHILFLPEQEWFREAAWCLEIISCFQ